MARYCSGEKVTEHSSAKLHYNKQNEEAKQTCADITLSVKFDSHFRYGQQKNVSGLDM